MSASPRLLKPQAAGRFYPAAPEACRALVGRALAEARAIGAFAPTGLVLPHGPHVACGAVIGTGFRALGSAARSIRRVIVVGPSHQHAFTGLVAPRADLIATPLGTCVVDRPALDRFADDSLVTIDDGPFEREHTIEVILPFLQVAIGAFTVVPLLTGRTPGPAVARVIDRLWGGPETLLIISSDLSRNLPHEEARTRDSETRGLLESLSADGLDDRASGFRAIEGMLKVARRRDMRITGLDMRTTAETIGNPSQVTGFGTFAIEPASRARVPDASRHALLAAVARALVDISAGRTTHPANAGGDPCLTARRACFISITTGGDETSIGSPLPHCALIADAVSHAEAAFRQGRLAAKPDQLAAARLDIDVLSHPRPLPAASADELADMLEPGMGVILDGAGRRAALLPAAREKIPDPRTFVAMLLRKGGWLAHDWSGLRAFGFSTERFGAPIADLVDPAVADNERRVLSLAGS